jgi:hypothetical protein
MFLLLSYLVIALSHLCNSCSMLHNVREYKCLSVLVVSAVMCIVACKCVKYVNPHCHSELVENL